MNPSDFIIKIELDDGGGTVSLGNAGDEGIGDVFLEPADGEKSVLLNDDILALILGIRKAEREATD